MVRIRLEFAKQSEMLFGAPFLVCVSAPWIVKGFRFWWYSAVALCFLDSLLYCMFCCLVRVVAAIFMGCVCFHCQQVFFSPLLSHPSLSPLLLYTLRAAVVCQFVHTHTYFTHTCHTHFIALVTVLICIGTGEKIKTTPGKAQCQKLYLNLLKELCIRFRLVFLCRCYPWVIPWRNNSLFVWQE